MRKKISRVTQVEQRSFFEPSIFSFHRQKKSLALHMTKWAYRYAVPVLASTDSGVECRGVAVVNCPTHLSIQRHRWVLIWYYFYVYEKEPLLTTVRLLLCKIWTLMLSCPLSAPTLFLRYCGLTYFACQYQLDGVQKKAHTSANRTVPFNTITSHFLYSHLFFTCVFVMSTILDVVKNRINTNIHIRENFLNFCKFLLYYVHKWR